MEDAREHKQLLTAPPAYRQGIRGPKPAHRTAVLRLDCLTRSLGAWVSPALHRRRCPPVLRYRRRLPPPPGRAAIPSPTGRGLTLALISKRANKMRASE